jgi:hypothetical protein
MDNKHVDKTSDKEVVNIKKDALWKPLLRQFRRSVKRSSQAKILKKSLKNPAHTSGTDEEMDVCEIKDATTSVNDRETTQSINTAV